MDISSYKVETIKPVRLANTAIPTGSLCGSSFLNRIYADRLQKMFGFSDNDKKKMKWLQRAVKHFDEEIKKTFTGEEVAGYRYYVDVVGQNFSGPAAKDISDDELPITAKFIKKEVFDPVISKIVRLVQDQVSATQNLKAVLLVGGFGENAYLRKRLVAAVGKQVEVRSVKDGYVYMCPKRDIGSLDTLGTLLLSWLTLCL